MSSDNLKKKGKICIPGMRLSLSDKDYSAGPGTYELRGYIYASLCGSLNIEKDENKVTYNAYS